MTTSAWANLPNAKHIDRILVDIKARPKVWGTAWHLAWNIGPTAPDEWARSKAREVAYVARQNAIRHEIWKEAFGAIWGEAKGAARDTAWCAIQALISWDDCAHMLESDVGELKILAAFGNPQAILLLPACIVFSKEIMPT